MAVTLDATLPDQPGGGTTQYLPLGGDGYTSPQSTFVVQASEDTDGSGGQIRININRDPRFLSVAVQIGFFNTNTTVGAIQVDIRTSGVTFQHTLPAAPINPGGTMTGVFMPPPYWHADRWSISMLNTDTFNLSMRLILLNFKIDAVHRVPLTLLNQGIQNYSSFV